MSNYTGTTEQRGVLVEAGMRNAYADEEFFEARRVATWAIETYNEGVNIPFNFDMRTVEETLQAEKGVQHGALDLEDIIYEVGSNRVPAYTEQVANVFYWGNVYQEFDDWMEDFTENGQNYDIGGIMQHGVFGLSLFLVRKGYEKRDDGEV